jgi:flagellar biosynthesis anti-sigma factor FlgM
MEVSGKGVFKQLPNLIQLETGLKTEENTGRVAPAAAGTGDKVVLSPRAREIDEAKHKLMNMPDIRADRVNAIRHQIDSGTYMVTGDKIAFRMLQESVLNQRVIA